MSIKYRLQGKFTPPQARYYIRQLIDGVQACHDIGLSHRNLKPENLLLDASGDLKICDAGLGGLYFGDPDAIGCNMTVDGAGRYPHYVAPEIILGHSYNGDLADIWSMGVIMYVLLAGYLPFDEHTTYQLFDKIKRADFTCPAWFELDAVSLLQRVLVADPKQRISLQEFRSSLFVSNSDTPVTAPFPLWPLASSTIAAAEAAAGGAAAGAGTSCGDEATPRFLPPISESRRK